MERWTRDLAGLVKKNKETPMYNINMTYEIARSHHEELRRQSENEHRLRRLDYAPESAWRKNRVRIMRLLSLFF